MKNYIFIFLTIYFTSFSINALDINKTISNAVNNNISIKIALEELNEAIAGHCLNAAEKIRSESLLAKSITVFIRTSSFQKIETCYSNSKTIDFPVATDNSIEIVKVALLALKDYWKYTGSSRNF